MLGKSTLDKPQLELITSESSSQEWYNSLAAVEVQILHYHLVQGQNSLGQGQSDARMDHMFWNLP